MAVIEQLKPDGDPADERGHAFTAVTVPEVDERAARRTLRAQIARLESDLAAACLDACPRIDPGPPPAALRGPRILSLGELERVRDELTGRIAAVRATADSQLLQQTESRMLLDRMVEDPPAHKWLRVSNTHLGEPGCKHFHVRPRLGPLGLLMGWWCVKVSSGCPLAWGP